MYVDSLAILAIEKFKKFILDYQDTINTQLLNLEEKIKRESKLLELRETRDVQALLNAKPFFLSINPALESKFKTIEFFVSNDAKNAEQVITSLDYILESCRTHIENNQNDNYLKMQYLEAIEKCDRILKDDFSDLDFVQKILSVSTLTDDEKLNVLAKLAFDSCSLTKEKEESNTPIINDEFDEVVYLKICELRDKVYLELKQKANDVINRNYAEYIQCKSDEDLNYARAIVSSIDKKELSIEEVSNFNYVREKLTILLFTLINEKEEIDRLLEIFSSKVKEDDVELLEEALKDFEKMISSIIEAENDLSKENQVIADSKNSSNIYFLLDKGGKLLFDVDEFHNDDKKRISVLLDKTQKGILDYDKGFKHTIVQSPHKMNNLIEVNKYSNFACIYIRFAKDKILILSVGEVKDIYDEGIYIDSHYEDRIEELKQLLINDDVDEMKNQINILEYLNEKLEIEKVK